MARLMSRFGRSLPGSFLPKQRTGGFQAIRRAKRGRNASVWWKPDARIISFFMNKLLVAGVVAVVIAVSFGAGVWIERLLIEHRLVTEPCSVRTWQPSLGFVSTSLDPRDCLSHGRSRAFDGEWDDFAYGGAFRPVAGGRAQVFDFVADGMAKAQIQWLADNKSRPAEFSGKTYRIRFIGRIAHRQGPIADGHTDVVILERVVDASLVRRVGQAN